MSEHEHATGDIVLIKQRQAALQTETDREPLCLLTKPLGIDERGLGQPLLLSQLLGFFRGNRPLQLRVVERGLRELLFATKLKRERLAYRETSARGDRDDAQ